MGKFVLYDGSSDGKPDPCFGKWPGLCLIHIILYSSTRSSEAGAQRLDKMVENIRKARTGTPEQGKQINPDNFLPA